MSLALTVNNKLRQQGGTHLMMVKPDEILTELQSFVSLEDGDIVMTGTPKGVGVIHQAESFVGQVYLHTADSLAVNKLLVSNKWQAQ